jgi:hypothetical protein
VAATCSSNCVHGIAVYDGEAHSDGWRLSDAPGIARSTCLIAGSVVGVAVLVFDRAEHLERRVESSTVMEDLKVLKDGVGQLEVCVSAFLVQKLILQPRPARFHLAVVMAIADGCHRQLHQSGVKRSMCERPGRELGGSIDRSNTALREGS